MRRMPALLVVAPMLLTGACGGGETTTTTPAAGASASAPAGGAGASASAPAAVGADGCPTENTRSFAKTRFAADLGGAAFLVNRYIYQPYSTKKFEKGASGRRLALVKGAAAAAASVKLLDNATENAKANPTLCRSLAAPLTQLSGTLKGLTGSLTSGSFNPALLGGLGGAVSGLLGKAGQAGVPVTETPTSLG